MKKILLFAAALLVATGCQKSKIENEVTPSVEENVIQKQTLVAYAPGADATTTKIDAEEDPTKINLAWRLEDEISIFDQTSGDWVCNSVVTSIDPTTGAATFEKLDGADMVDQTNYVAVYPTVQTTQSSLTDRDAENYFFEHSSDGSDDLTGLDDRLRMKSKPFVKGDKVVFEHEMALMRITCGLNSPVSGCWVFFMDGDPLYSSRLSFDAARRTFIANFFILPSSTTHRDVAVSVRDNATGEEYTETRSTQTAFEAGKIYTWNPFETAVEKPFTVKIEGDISEITLQMGQSAKLNAVLSPETATSQTVFWESYDESVVTVTQGLITAVGKGSTHITVESKIGGIADIVNVTVESSELDPTNLKLEDISVLNFPSANEWVITNQTAAEADYQGLKDALAAVGLTRKIDLIFPNLEEISQNAFYEARKSIFTVSAPSATIVGEKAFMGSYIKSFKGNAVETIAEFAFYTTPKLQEISVRNVSSIQWAAIAECDRLESVTMDELTVADKDVFAHCYSIRSASFAKLETVPSNFMTSNYSLESINLPKATIIGDQAFKDCLNLTSVDMQHVSQIMDNAFFSCKNLASITMPALKIIGASAFAQCSSLSDVEFNSVTTVGEAAFYFSSVTSVSMNEAETLGNGVFQDCSSLSSVSLNSAIEIGENAFMKCTSLVSVDLPQLSNSVDKGLYLFRDCSNLQNVSMTNLPALAYGMFLGCGNLVSVDVPAAIKWDQNVFDNVNDVEHPNMTELKIGVNAQVVSEHNIFSKLPVSKMTIYSNAHNLNMQEKMFILPDEGQTNIGPFFAVETVL